MTHRFSKTPASRAPSGDHACARKARASPAYCGLGSGSRSRGYGWESGIWDATTGERLTSMDAQGATAVVGSFTPDGEHIVVAYWNGTARVYNTAGGDELFLLTHDERRQTPDDQP